MLKEFFFSFPGTIDCQFSRIAGSSGSIRSNARVFSRMTGTCWVNGNETVSLVGSDRNWWMISIDRNTVEGPRYFQRCITADKGTNRWYRFSRIYSFVGHFEGRNSRGNWRIDKIIFQDEISINISSKRSHDWYEQESKLSNVGQLFWMKNRTPTEFLIRQNIAGYYYY